MQSTEAALLSTGRGGERHYTSLDDGVILPPLLGGIYSTAWFFLLPRLVPLRRSWNFESNGTRFINKRQLSFCWCRKNLANDGVGTICPVFYLFILLLIYKFYILITSCVRVFMKDTLKNWFLNNQIRKSYLTIRYPATTLGPDYFEFGPGANKVFPTRATPMRLQLNQHLVGLEKLL